MDKKNHQSKVNTAPKPSLHKRNKHHGRYDLQALCKTLPLLKEFVFTNEHGNESIDFFNPQAVLALNKALLKHYYAINFWDIPANYLCPPIPGRADYIHHIADILAKGNNNIIPKGNNIKLLDIGTGANCIYPLIAQHEYQWTVIGSELDPIAFKNAENIVLQNKSISKVEIRKQSDANFYFKNIIAPNEYFNISICNPPFHPSAKEALASSQRKIKNLTGKNTKNPTLNFGGKNNELWCTGGEITFIDNMIKESKAYAKNVGWFTTLVSKQSNLKIIEKSLKEANVKQSNIIKMGHGNKMSRFVAWRF